MPEGSIKEGWQGAKTSTAKITSTFPSDPCYFTTTLASSTKGVEVFQPAREKEEVEGLH